MEVKPGYKQTEVGVIPVEWEVFQLGELISYTKGFPFKSSDYQSTGIRVVRVSDTTYDSIKAEDPIYVSESSASRYVTWQLKEHDLVVSTVGSKPPMYDSMVGKVILIDQSHQNTLLNQNAVLIRDRKHRGYVQRLLLNHLRTKRYLLHIEAIYRGNANQASITLKELFQFRIPLPSDDPEQRAIATALSDVDGLLGGLDRLIAKKRDLKQAAMQQLLTGQTRLPGFHGEWEVKRLGELGSTYGGLTGKTKADFGEGSARYITFMNIMSNVVIDCGTFEQVQVSPTESQNRAMKGDLFFNGSSETPEEVAMCAVLLNEVHDVYLNSFCFGFRFREDAEADGFFLAYYLRSKEGRELMKSLAQGSTRYNLSKVALLKSPLRLPALPEQTAIAEVLTEMDAELTALEQRREKTRALKQAMMQELLTGRTRLV